MKINKNKLSKIIKEELTNLFEAAEPISNKQEAEEAAENYYKTFCKDYKDNPKKTMADLREKLESQVKEMRAKKHPRHQFWCLAMKEHLNDWVGKNGVRENHVVAAMTRALNAACAE